MPEQTKKKLLFHINRKWELPLFVITFLLSLHITAASTPDATFQSIVSGTISDASGLPLPGASIIEKGTTNGTQTDFDGNFSISVSDQATLVISYIGYATQEISVDGRSSLAISLQEDANQLDEVILVGYGTKSRTSVTSAISSVDNDELVETPAIGVQQALQGRAAGVQVTNAGAPGTSPLVTIRGLSTFGNNEPLFIVDGVPTGSLNNIPPESIESVDVLKDAASAAIYGSRGSNGVILIKTKAGRRGKTKFRVNTYGGTSNVVKTVDVLNTQQYIDYVGEFDFNNDIDGNQPPAGFSDPSFDPTINTDWQNEVLQTGSITNYDIEASGGNEKATYSVRAGYFDQKGTILKTDFKRYSVGINTTFNLSDKITFGQTLSLGISRANNEPGAGTSVLTQANRMVPYLPVFNESTNFFSTTSTNFDGQDAVNPVQLLLNNDNITDNTTLVGSIFGSYELIEGLTYKLTIGLDHSYTNVNQFGRFIPTGQFSRDFAETQKSRNRFLGTVVTNTLNYNFNIKEKNNFDVLLGYENNRDDNDFVRVVTQNPLTDQVENLNPNPDQLQALDNSTLKNNLQSVFGRISYNYDDIVLLSGTVRRDGSSRFGANNRWGTFPSVSAGLNIARLAFEDNETFTNFKLRGSWGITGNNNIGNYLFSTGLQTDFNYVLNGNLVSGTRPIRLANPDLKWEELTSVNIGADLGFFQNTLTVSLEYFQNNSDGLLVDVPTPASSGDIRGNLTQNVGGTESSGVEVNLGYKDYEGDFTWGVNMNLGTLKAEVTSLGGVSAIPGGGFENQDINRLLVGEAPFYFFGYETDGIFQTETEVTAANQTLGTPQPGDVRFRDINDDGVVDADDRTNIGNPIPDLTLGIDFNFQYKNIDLSVFANGVYGNEVYNGTLYRLIQQDRLFNRGTQVLNRWTGPGTSNTVPRAAGSTANILPSDRFVEDGSFTRLRNITLGYSFEDKVLKNVLNGSVTKLRVYLSGQNLATFTDYSGYDPEIIPIRGDGQSINAVGLDRGAYPQPRTFLAGLQLEF